MTRVLLVSPRFHGYWRSIADALGAAGHDVVVHRYDERSTGESLRHKLTHELPQELSLRIRSARVEPPSCGRAAIAALRESGAEAAVVVRGDVLGPEFWAELDALRLPRVLWLYDEVRRTSWSPAALADVGPLATYSRLDAAALGAVYLPLAFDPGLADPAPVVEADEVVFVGARYPSRERVLLGLQAAGVPVRAFGRDWSRHPVDRLRTWDVRRPRLAAGRDLPREQTYSRMAGALAALNLHGDQDGFTMRTFEACGVGGLQLLDRRDVEHLYEPGSELLTFSGVAEAAELVDRARRDPGWSAAIRDKGRARTRAEHTFAHRVRVLEELWRSWG